MTAQSVTRRPHGCTHAERPASREAVAGRQLEKSVGPSEGIGDVFVGEILYEDANAVQPRASAKPNSRSIATASNSVHIWWR
jgi:hypothetical protein